MVHHVNVLLDAATLRVVRTRRVRAIDERYYGRTARLFRVGVISRPDLTPPTLLANDLSVAAAESGAAYEAMVLRWTAAGMLNAQRSFRRVKGYKQMPQLVAAPRHNIRRDRHSIPRTP